MSDLVFEYLKRIQADITDLKRGQHDIKAEIIALKDIMGAFFH